MAVTSAAGAQGSTLHLDMVWIDEVPCSENAVGKTVRCDTAPGKVCTETGVAENLPSRNSELQAVGRRGVEHTGNLEPGHAVGGSGRVTWR